MQLQHACAGELLADAIATRSFSVGFVPILRLRGSRMRLVWLLAFWSALLPAQPVDLGQAGQNAPPAGLMRERLPAAREPKADDVQPANTHGSADQLILGRIYPTGSASKPVTALAVDAEGRVLAYGDAKVVRLSLANRGRPLEQVIIDGTVIPGLIDAHGHLLGLGFSLLQADLVGTHDRSEILDRLAATAKGLGASDWLLGRGWDQNDWPQSEYPTRAQLDLNFPDRPVWLERVDGHAGWANSAALKLAGIDANTVDPEGGRILRDAQGEPTGVLIDAAMNLLQTALPKPSREQQRRALQLAVNVAARAGLTGVHDAGVSREELAILQDMADAGDLPIRIYAMADGDAEALADLCRSGPYQHSSGRLAMRAVKLYADGALGSRGAALLAPYADEPKNSGLMIQSPQALRALVAKAAKCKIQPAVHAIGDRASRVVLDAYAALPAAVRKALRPRIEHAQVVALPDIARFAQLGVIASMQPTHATSDMPWAQQRVGPERLRGAYAWRRFLDAKVALALGSDFPVERVDPLLGIYAAVTRQDSDGQPADGWLPDQRLSLEQALDGFTRGAAYAAGQEQEVGSLEVGRRADFTVLSVDPHVVRGRGLLAIKVRSTWLDGKLIAGLR